MSPTFETVLTQAKRLSESERAKLIQILSIPEVRRNGTEESRRKKIHAFRGKYRGILPSTEEFMEEKRKEVELEERKWRS